MPNLNHLKILKQGAAAWNEFRQQQSIDFPDFPDCQDASIDGICLAGVNFRGANLRGATFCEVDLQSAFLRGVDLQFATFERCDLSDANIKGNLENCEIKHSKLIGTRFSGASAALASITDCILSEVDFSGANLAFLDFSGSTLQSVNFCEATLYRTNFDRTTLHRVVFANNDLSKALGLENANHRGHSTLGIDTIYKSCGQIPDEFLREAGIPLEAIDLARTLRAEPPIQWHSCFISFSTKDEEFVRQLRTRMREANMRVWFAPEDLKGGEKLHEQLFKAIQIQDRLLFVLSENSIKSEWVMNEIRKAREVERRENRRKLFPVRLVDFDTLRNWTCFDADSGKDLAVEVREYFIPDFSNWKNEDAFERAFVRLRQDLKIAVEFG